MYLQNKQLWMILFSRMISASVFLGSILITYLKNTPGWYQHNSQTEVPPPTAHPLHTNQQLHFEQCKWRKNKVIKVAEMFQSTEIPKGYLWKSRKHETSTTPLFCSESGLNQEGLFLLLEKDKRGNFHRPITLVDSFDLWYWRLQLPLLASRLVEKGFPHTVCINL